MEKNGIKGFSRIYVFSSVGGAKYVSGENHKCSMQMPKMPNRQPGWNKGIYFIHWCEMWVSQPHIFHSDEYPYRMQMPPPAQHTQRWDDCFWFAFMREIFPLMCQLSPTLKLVFPSLSIEVVIYVYVCVAAAAHFDYDWWHSSCVCRTQHFQIGFVVDAVVYAEHTVKPHERKTVGGIRRSAGVLWKRTPHITGEMNMKWTWTWTYPLSLLNVSTELIDNDWRMLNKKKIIKHRHDLICN